MTTTSGTNTPKRFRVHHFAQAKEQGRRIAMLTAYDAMTARIFDEAGIETLLVGDSFGNTVLGQSTTVSVTLDEMIPHVRAVARATSHAFVVADLPFGTYEASPDLAFASAVRMMKEGEAHSVKMEGGRRIAKQVELLTRSGIPVMGHLGFTPQSENVLGGKRIQGRGEGAIDELKEDAVALQEAGAYAIVLEMIPTDVAAQLTEILRIPTIGIGAGPHCDGQVLVWYDMAGMGEWSPSFVKRFAELGQELTDAAKAYADEVREGIFPDEDHSFAQ